MSNAFLALFWFQLTMQITLSVSLEGQTSHYVRLLESPVADDNVKRITCPVYSIRPEGETAMFTKYSASKAQFEKVSDWEEKTDAQTFKDCAAAAATDGAKMFLFDDESCTISKTALIRLAETCGDEEATIVYMDETIPPPDDSCATDYLWLNKGEDVMMNFCGLTGTTVTCLDGTLFTVNDAGNLGVYKINEGCYYIHQKADIAHDQHQNECAQLRQETCKPAHEESRAAFIQTIGEISQSLRRSIIVDCTYTDVPNPPNFLWGNDVVQPTDVAEEWMFPFPQNPFDQNKYVYVDPSGIANFGNIGLTVLLLQRRVMCKLH